MSTSRPDGTVLRHPDLDEPLHVTAGDLRELVIRGALEWGANEATAETLGLDVSSALRRIYAERVERRAVTRNVSEIEPMSVRWLWHHRIPYGMLSEVCGDPGEGKSHLTLAIAAAETLGVHLPGDPEAGSRAPGLVLLVCIEDSPEATVRPRLEGMGADLNRVTILDGFRGEHGDADPLDLSRKDHRMELRRLVEELGITLVVIDPITAHLGGANEWKDGEVRAVLAPLARLADETGAAVLLVRHLRKSDSSRAIYRAGGSIAFTASVRSSLMLGRPNGEERRRAIVRVKGNLSPEPPAVGFVLDENGWGWTDAGEWTAADLLGGDVSSEERTARDEAADFLREALGDGARPAREVQDDARRLGITDRTLRRARQATGVIVEREGPVGPGQKWTWKLPAEVAKRSDHLETADRSGHLGESKAGEGTSGDSDARGGHKTFVYGQVATSENGEPPATCADCGRPVPPNPAFDVLRCVPCGMKAGKEARDHA